MRGDVNCDGAYSILSGNDDWNNLIFPLESLNNNFSRRPSIEAADFQFDKHISDLVEPELKVTDTLIHRLFLNDDVEESLRNIVVPEELVTGGFIDLNFTDLEAVTLRRSTLSVLLMLLPTLSPIIPSFLLPTILPS
jgi:hypothetical protein